MSAKLVQAHVAAEDKDQKFLAVCMYAFTEIVCNFRVILAQGCTGTEETTSSLQKSPLLGV